MKSPLSQLITALLVFFAVLGGYIAWYEYVVGKSETLASVQNQIDLETQTATRVAAAKAALTEISGDEAAMQQYFVSEPQIVGFLDDLQQRSKSVGSSVAVTSVSTTNTGHPGLVLSLQAKGTFDQVMRTIGVIEYAPYDLTVSDLALSGDAKDGWHADISAIVGFVSVSAASSTSP